MDHQLVGWVATLAMFFIGIVFHGVRRDINVLEASVTSMGKDVAILLDRDKRDNRRRSDI